MYIYKVLANRQLAQYNSDDKNINVSSEKKYIFQTVIQNILDKKITSINHKELKIARNGETQAIAFTIEDIVLKESFSAYFAKSPRELRLQLKMYVENRKIIPGDVITIYIEVNEPNCNIKIKSDSMYRYVLERKSKTTAKYRIMTEFPESKNNAGITVSKYTNNYLKSFKIDKLEESIAFGKTDFTAYSLDGIDTKYICVPHDKNLELNCFETIDGIEEVI